MVDPEVVVSLSLLHEEVKKLKEEKGGSLFAARQVVRQRLTKMKQEFGGIRKALQEDAELRLRVNEAKVMVYRRKRSLGRPISAIPVVEWTGLI